MSTRSTWIVWRDGWRCELQAYDLGDALSTSWSIVDDGGRATDPWTFEIIGTGERAEPPLLLIPPDPEAVSHSRIIRRLGEHEVIVEDTPEAYRIGLLALTERCNAWADARAGLALLPKPHVERFRSGKKAGQPKWSKHHTGHHRAVISKQLADIEAAEERVDAAIDRVLAALDVLDEERVGCLREWPELVRSTPWDSGEEAVVLLRDRVTTACLNLVEFTAHRYTKAGAPDHSTLAWLREHEAKLAYELAKFDSIRRYGFAPGETVEIRPTGPDNPVGRARVVGIRVREERRRWSPEPIFVHERVVEWNESTYEIDVKCLRMVQSDADITS